MDSGGEKILAGSLDIPLKILSLLEGDLEKRLCRGLIGKRRTEYFSKYAPELNNHPQTLLHKPFWAQLPADAYDIIIFELHQQHIVQLHNNLNPQNHSEIWTDPVWSRINAATVTVLPESNLENLERAVQLGFDGIWTEPLNVKTVMDKLHDAFAHARRRRYRHDRLNRLRRLCRKVNLNRRHLRNKVDLLCRDLISSNVQFADTMLDLHRAYDFQTELTGEFDRRYLMYKALQIMKNTLGHCSSALYLSRSNQFEAHIAGMPQNTTEDIAAIEELFSAAVVPAILDSEQILMLNNSQDSDTLAPKQKWLLKNWTILALPVIYRSHLQAVLVFYRHHAQPFTTADRDKLRPMIQPLAQTLASLYKLEQHIHLQ